MDKLSDILTTIQDRLFKSIISNNLIYNSCWEDPRIDRKLLQLDTESRVLMLSSAGCNALDYLLDNPREIHCVDINPAQNALLELKIALIENNNFQLLWDFFGNGSKRGAELIYHRQLRPLLSPDSQTYWDQNIGYFVPTSTSPSFYFHGTSGNMARIIHNYIQRKGLYPEVLNLLNANSLEEQTYYYDEIEPQLWNTFSKWLADRRTTMAMLGVPSAQSAMIEERYDGGISQFIRQSLRRIFTKLPIRDNYFWRVYLTGSYSRQCCPNYLAKQYFQTLGQRTGNIQAHTTSLLQYLKQSSGTYSHFILLDHQDWMAHTQPEQLARQWKLILSKSQSGSRILFRSAGSAPDFLPDFVFEHVEFQPEATHELHKKDRVGTYESTYLGIVR